MISINEEAKLLKQKDGKIAQKTPVGC